MKKRMTGAEILLESLIAEGVDTLFGYPGGQILTVYDKLYDYSTCWSATNRGRFTPPRAMREPPRVPGW